MSQQPVTPAVDNITEQLSRADISDANSLQRSGRCGRVNDPPMFDGNPAKLSNFITHVKMSIYSDSSRFVDEITKICEI
ncbi:hypothetical protein BDB01DRAFT_733881 [Pilobolus umbonatus]|nr:hypothetical protein BDB01DRAFT_733881 [Pilobolus umbonatus]